MLPDVPNKLAGTIAVILLLSGCSTADYGPAVAKFAEATKTAETTLTKLDREIVDARAQVLRSRATSGDYRAEFGRSTDGQGNMRFDCQFDSDRCRLIVINNDDDSHKEYLRSGTNDNAIPNMLAVMKSIKIYSDNLNAIFNAKTASTATANVNAALGSIEELANTVRKVGNKPQSTTPIPEFSTPVGQAAGWLIGQYVTTVQIEGLKRATEKANMPISDAANLFTGVAGIAAEGTKRRLSDAVLDRNDAYAMDRSPENFDKLVAASNAYDLFLRAKPSNIFTSLEAAHNALYENLHKKDISYAEAFKQIEAFAAEAATLKKVIDDLMALGEKKEN